MDGLSPPDQGGDMSDVGFLSYDVCSVVFDIDISLINLRTLIPCLHVHPHPNKKPNNNTHTHTHTQVLEIHSRRSQAQRTKTSDEFRKSKTAIMFSSDVSARGMDYPDVSFVLQVGLTEREQYVCVCMCV